MSQTPEHANDPTGPVTAAVAAPPFDVEPAVVENKPNRLYQAAAWVAIVAGTLFIVAVIFFTGFVMGRHSGGSGHFGGHGWGPGMMMDRQGPNMHHRDGSGGGPGGPGGPGWMRPGDRGDDAPGNFGPANPGGQGGPGPSPSAPPSR